MTDQATEYEPITEALDCAVQADDSLHLRRRINGPGHDPWFHSITIESDEVPAVLAALGRRGSDPVEPATWAAVRHAPGSSKHGVIIAQGTRKHVEDWEDENHVLRPLYFHPPTTTEQRPEDGGAGTTAYEIETIYRIWSEHDGRIEVGEDGDGLGMVDVRQYEGDRMVARVSGPLDQLRKVAEAITRLCEELDR